MFNENYIEPPDFSKGSTPVSDDTRFSGSLEEYKKIAQEREARPWTADEILEEIVIDGKLVAECAYKVLALWGKAKEMGVQITPVAHEELLKMDPGNDGEYFYNLLEVISAMKRISVEFYRQGVLISDEELNQRVQKLKD